VATRVVEPTHPEVTGEDLELRPWDGNAFNKGMFLVFERQHSFVEYDPFVHFSEHAHDALHEILMHC